MAKGRSTRNQKPQKSSSVEDDADFNDNDLDDDSEALGNHLLDQDEVIEDSS